MENSSNRQFWNFGALHRSIAGKLNQNRELGRKMIFYEFRGVMPRNSKIDDWMSLPEIDLTHTPNSIKTE